MSKMAMLAYEIEELYTTGLTPKLIAQELNIPIEQVLGWLEAVDCMDQN